MRNIEFFFFFNGKEKLNIPHRRNIFSFKGPLAFAKVERKIKTRPTLRVRQKRSNQKNLEVEKILQSLVLG